MESVGKVVNGKFVPFGNTGNADRTILQRIQGLETGKLDKIGNASQTTVTFEQAAKLANVNSGDSMSVALGKLSKLYAELEGKSAFYPVSTSRDISEEGVLMDGKTVADWFSELNGKLGAANIPSLTTSVLDKALELEGVGLYFYRLGGSNYVGNDLPKINYANGSVLIFRRSPNTIAVLLMGSDNDTSLAMNYYFVNKWLGWQAYMRSSDLGYIHCIVEVTANNVLKIQASPTDMNYIPVVVSHSTNNNCIDHVFYDNLGGWMIYSTHTQRVGIRFYKYPV